MLPEIAQRLKAFASGFGSKIEPLDLKGGFGLTPLDWYQRNGFYGIADKIASSAPAWSGESVNLNSALNHSVVWACNRAISEPTGFLPLNLMRATSSGKNPAYDHPMYSALHDAPNEEMTAMTFRETLTSHALLQGNGFAQIIRRSGTGVALELRALSPQQVTVEREATGERRLVYVVRESGNSDKAYTLKKGEPHDIFHLKGISNNGIVGYSVLSVGRQSIGTGLSAERHVAKFYANGGRLPYNLKVSKSFANDQDAGKFRADWESIYSQPGRAPILEPWLEYQTTGISLKDSQMLETREFTIPDICRWFNVSPHLAGDLSHATFSNVEQLALDHVKFCLQAWFKRWEEELFRCVLTPAEKQSGYYFRHNVDALLRGDFVSRMAGYASALQNAHLNVDEVRDLEDRNPLPDGRGGGYHLQLNMQTLPTGGGPLQVQQDPASAHLAAQAKKESIRHEK